MAYENFSLVILFLNLVLLNEVLIYPRSFSCTQRRLAKGYCSTHLNNPFEDEFRPSSSLLHDSFDQFNTSGSNAHLAPAAAKELGVTNHVIRRLIKDAILPAKQVVDGAPYQIRTEDLQSDQVIQALRRKKRPCRTQSDQQLSMFTST